MRQTAWLTGMLLWSALVHAQNTDTMNISTLSDSIRRQALEEVTVRGKKSFIQVLADKTLINPDASPTNTTATVLELLEKSPGITFDRNGTISLKGRQGVMIMIDGKPTQVSGSDLNNLLQAMVASQIEQIEIIDNPSSKFDASGNAGIIHIKTKKNKQKGFNGNVNVSIAQGKLTRNSNNVSVNYNTGKLNLFANFTGNLNRNFTNLYAIRSYYADNNTTITSKLEQPSYFKGRAPSGTIKAGVDYSAGKKTSIGFVVSQMAFKRTSTGTNPAVWMDEDGNTDSIIVTKTNNEDRMNHHSLNVNGRHAFSNRSEVSIDLDFLGYRIRNKQMYTNTLAGAGGYTEEITGNLPANINIITGKADYSYTPENGYKLEAGWKSSQIKTNNNASYYIRNGGPVVPDFSKTNHFIYNENIHAAYLNSEKKFRGWLLQAGIRYENTSYEARQLGNAMRKDSSFSRRYDGLFPSANVVIDIDTNHSISVSAGRRIDRPPFQSLNPFVFVINKYTMQAGNPFYRPQYTWNTEATHTFRNKLVTSISYSRTDDYFSQVFLQDTSGIITYTEGNLDKMRNVGLAISYQSSINSWWSLTAATSINHKMISGYVWDERKTRRTQANFNVNNQFTFGDGWSGEISGFYQLQEQELQEITDPTGQLSLGIAKQILKNRGSVRFAFRDIFYSQAMKGFTVFENSTEYFSIKRDSRFASIAFTYRFGSQLKPLPARIRGGAAEEIQRVQQGG